jgi:hypothetical protein
MKLKDVIKLMQGDDPEVCAYSQIVTINIKRGTQDEEVYYGDISNYPTKLDGFSVLEVYPLRELKGFSEYGDTPDYNLPYQINIY